MSNIQCAPRLVASFINLQDTPAAYAGNAGEYLRVNAVPDAIEFVVNLELPNAGWVGGGAAAVRLVVDTAAAPDEFVLEDGYLNIQDNRIQFDNPIPIGDLAFLYLATGAAPGQSYIVVQLCDAAAASYFSIEDSATVEVFRVDSDGDVTVVDDAWVGLTGPGGRISFDNQAVDLIRFLDCYVSVGTGSPTTYELEVYDGSGSAIARITSNTDDALLMLDSNQDGVGTEESGVRLLDNGVLKWRVRKDTSNDFQIYNDNLGALAVEVDTGTSRFGIGAAPTFKFDVYEDRSGTYAARIWNDGNNNDRDGLAIWAGADANPACEFVTFRDGNGTYCGTVQGDGAGGVDYLPPSDARLKNVLGPVSQTLAMEALVGVTPIRYVGKGLTAETGRRNIGFTAQALAPFFPETVSYSEEEDVYSLSYDKLTPILWAQNQALLARIEELEKICGRGSVVH